MAGRPRVCLGVIGSMYIVFLGRSSLCILSDKLVTVNNSYVGSSAIFTIASDIDQLCQWKLTFCA